MAAKVSRLQRWSSALQMREIVRGNLDAVANRVAVAMIDGEPLEITIRVRVMDRAAIPPPVDGDRVVFGAGLEIHGMDDWPSPDVFREEREEYRPRAGEGEADSDY